MTSPATKFRKSAQSLQKKIDHKRAPRLTNTAKRMREWESAIQDALRMEKLQDKLNALADGWDNITLPVELSTLKDVAQVEYLLFQERPPTNTTTDSYARMQRAELLDPERYAEARAALLAMGDKRAGQEDKSIQLKRIEMDVDNSRIAGYFPTPEAVIRRMLEQVEILIEPGDHILEPSAGKGSIADVLRKEYPDAVLHCVEWNRSLREILELKDHTVICDDIFDENLTAYHHKYKLIVANPPWGKEYGAAEDARHILHCYENFLAEDGQLISVVSASAAYNQNKDYAKFRELVEERGYFLDVPQGAFKNADRSTGTSVKIVVLDKRSDSNYVPAKPVQVEEPEKVDMRRLMLDLDMTSMRRDAAGAKVDFNLRQLGYAKDNKMIDGHILNYAAIRVRRCVLPVFTAKLIGLPEAELQRLVDEKRLAAINLRSGRGGYHLTWQGASYTTHLWEDLKPKIDKFLDWYVTEPQGISETIIRDLEEAIGLMKQINDANEREASDAWLKAVNDTARELDAITLANRHKSNADHQVLVTVTDEQLDNAGYSKAVGEYRDLHNQWKELAKADPVEWYQQQKQELRYKVGDVVVSYQYEYVGRIERIIPEYLAGVHYKTYYSGVVLSKTDKRSSFHYPVSEADTQLQPLLDSNLFIPHRGEEGRVTEVLQEGMSVRIKTDSGEAIQIRTIDTVPIYKEESDKFPRKQVQNREENSPVDETPKMRQLRMF